MDTNKYMFYSCSAGSQTVVREPVEGMRVF
jgi:hypothetical protein